MSSYYKLTKHPETGQWERALWMDDYFGHYEYGVKFLDGAVVDPSKVKLETKDDMKEGE